MFHSAIFNNPILAIYCQAEKSYVNRDPGIWVGGLVRIQGCALSKRFLKALFAVDIKYKSPPFGFVDTDLNK